MVFMVADAKEHHRMIQCDSLSMFFLFFNLCGGEISIAAILCSVVKVDIIVYYIYFSDDQLEHNFFSIPFSVKWQFNL